MSAGVPEQEPVRHHQGTELEPCEVEGCEAPNGECRNWYGGGWVGCPHGPTRNINRRHRARRSTGDRRSAPPPEQPAIIPESYEESLQFYEQPAASEPLQEEIARMVDAYHCDQAPRGERYPTFDEVAEDEREGAREVAGAIIDRVRAASEGEERLSTEDERLLRDNLWDLYETDAPSAAEGERYWTRQVPTFEEGLETPGEVCSDLALVASEAGATVDAEAMQAFYRIFDRLRAALIKSAPQENKDR